MFSKVAFCKSVWRSSSISVMIRALWAMSSLTCKITSKSVRMAATLDYRRVMINYTHWGYVCGLCWIFAQLVNNFSIINADYRDSSKLCETYLELVFFKSHSKVFFVSSAKNVITSTLAKFSNSNGAMLLAVAIFHHSVNSMIKVT